MSRAALAIAVMVVLAADFQAAAQSSVYTQSNLNAQRLRNSARGFSAQQTIRDVNRNTVPKYAYNTLNRNLLNSATGASRAQKPFSNMGSRNGVSPYLGLSAPFSSTAEQYYTQVRPQLQQQRTNQQQAQRNAQFQKQLNSIAAQAPYDLQGTEGMAPTGHVSVYQNYGGYYPEPERRK